MEPWRTDIKDWTTLTKDLVNFYLAQAEACLKMSLEVHNIITLRAFTILSVLIPSITLSIGYLLMQPGQEPGISFPTIISIIGLSAAVICLVPLIILIFPRLWMQLGRQPKDFFTSEVVETETPLTSEQLYVGIVMNEIENIQYKIDFNDRSNSRRLKLLKSVIIIIALAFLTVIATLAIQLI
jgi:hypothetical protein